MRRNKLPKTVFVFFTAEQDEPVMYAERDIENIEDGAEVGVYELRMVTRKRVLHELQDKITRSKR